VTFTGSQIGLANGIWSAPTGAAVDGKGNLYIADRGNNRVVELLRSGSGFGAPVIILSGLSSPVGVAADWNGNVFVSDTGNNRILMLPTTTSGFGPSVVIAEGLNAPMGVAVDSVDNLYVADSGNDTIVELPLVGGVYGAHAVVSTGFKNPMGVAVDASRTLYIADTGNNRIVKEPFTAGGYPAQQLLLTSAVTPTGVWVDKSDNLYIADSANKRILEVTWFQAAGRYSNQYVIGTGFTLPAGVVTDASGEVYVTDSVNGQVMEVETGTIDFGAVSLDSSGVLLTYNFNIAAGTVVGSVNISMEGNSGKDFVDGGGSTCVAQTYSSSTYCGVNVKFAPLASGTRKGAVELSDANGNPLATAYISGVGDGPQIAVIPGTVTRLGAQLSGPSGVAIDGGGNVYISDTGNNRIVELPWTGSGYGPQATLPVAGLISPMGLAMDGAGNLYVASNGNDKVVKLARMGSGFGLPVKVIAGLNGPTGVTTDINGNVYITDTLNQRVDQVSWTGSGYSGDLNLGNYHRSPTGIAVDGQGNVYFSDPYQNTIAELRSSGTTYLIEIDLSSLQVSFPAALAVDGNSNLYILDSGNNRVIMLPWSGTGFGKQITVASGFNDPSGIAIGPSGQLLVADTGNNQIVEIDPSAPSTLSFANTYLGSTSADSARVALVENVGNESLSVAAVTYPVDFPESAGAVNPCMDSSSLNPGQWCELAVNFTPLTVGAPLTESVIFAGASSGVAGEQISLSATGTSLSKLAQTVNFPAIPSVTYSYTPVALSASASSGLPVTFAVISGSGVLVSGGRSLRVTGVGTVVVSATQAGTLGYQAASAEISILVAPAILTVIAQNTTATYGSIPVSFHYSITGFQPGDSPTTAVTGVPAIVSGVASNAAAGSYVLTASQGTLAAANYTFAFVPGTLTVNKAIVWVAAYSVIHTYGAPVKTLTWYLSGFVNGDTSGVASGAPVLTTAANSGAPVGSYPIVVSVGTLAATNYSFQGYNGLFTVQPAMLTVTPASQAITYGGTIPALTYWISGFMNGDTGTSVVQGAPAISTAATAGSAAGNYTISASLGTLAATNYVFRFSTGILTVNKAIIQVTPVNISMTYGGKVPALSYSLSGFANGDIAVAGVPSLSTVATSASKPGIYSISSSVGTLASTNYSFKYGMGVIAVGQAVLTVTAKPVSTTYGAALPVLTYSYTGFVNGDGNSTVKGAPSLTTGATSASSAGSYPIACATGTLTSQEYTFNCVNGTLTVNPAVIAVKGASLAMTYGASAPGLTYQLSGLVNGDAASVISGAPVITSSVTSASPAGVYPITITIGSLAAPNYTFSVVNGSVTVKKAMLMVTASSQSMTYGGVVPALTYTVAGFANGDSQQTAIAGAPQMTTTATSTSAIGNYLITPTAGSLTAQNYTFGFASAWMKVSKATLTVSANNLAMQVGGTMPALSYSVSGFVNADTEDTAVTGVPSLTTSLTTASQAGSYTIAVALGSLQAANYQFALMNGTLAVSQSSANLLRTVKVGPEPLFRYKFHGFQRLGVGLAQDSELGDDCGNVLCGGYVEGGVADTDAVGRKLLPSVVRDFDGAAFFDGNLVSGPGSAVDGGPRGGNVKGDAVLFGQDGDRVGADLIGHVAVGGNAVCSHDHGLDAALAHEAGGHVIAEDSGGDAVGHQLPGGEARALQEGAGFVGKDVNLLTALDGSTNDAQSCPVAAGGKGSGVAVGEHAAIVGH
jgi:sugar lactone lactonase YvrE